MKRAAIAIVVAACADTSALEKRVEQLEAELAKHSDADDRRFVRLSNEIDNERRGSESAGDWWCFAVYCKRTEEDCELGRAQLRVEWKGGSTVSQDALKEPCTARRIAYCQGRFCYPDLDLCLIKERETPTWPCSGVE